MLFLFLSHFFPLLFKGQLNCVTYSQDDLWRLYQVQVDLLCLFIPLTAQSTLYYNVSMWSLSKDIRNLFLPLFGSFKFEENKRSGKIWRDGLVKNSLQCGVKWREDQVKSVKTLNNVKQQNINTRLIQNHYNSFIDSQTTWKDTHISSLLCFSLITKTISSFLIF